jgi:hypothetical protein
VAYTLDTKVGELLKDPKAVEVAERYAPGISRNAMLGLFKGRTLRSLLEMPQARKAGITEDMVLKVLEEINGPPGESPGE